ncbi:NUDIX domain-containing protein [Streptomyces sp. NPDC048179]|uniref:NUDIX hydrolase n=1 Tax=Streptomyces sp. NPDC048179 TaxID=3365506 RepID=UPI0037135CC6
MGNIEVVPEKVAWVLVRDGRVLVTRNRGVDVFYFPGGKREPGESDAETLAREIEEELQSRIDTTTMEHVGTFETESDWFGYGDRARVSAVDQMVFDVLHTSGRLL